MNPKCCMVTYIDGIAHTYAQHIRTGAKGMVPIKWAIKCHKHYKIVVLKWDLD